jgi:uncharacterized membrane protein
LLLFTRSREVIDDPWEVQSAPAELLLAITFFGACRVYGSWLLFIFIERLSQ